MENNIIFYGAIIFFFLLMLANYLQDNYVRKQYFREKAKSDSIINIRKLSRDLAQFQNEKFVQCGQTVNTATVAEVLTDAIKGEIEAYKNVGIVLPPLRFKVFKRAFKIVRNLESFRLQEAERILNIVEKEQD